MSTQTDAWQAKEEALAAGELTLMDLQAEIRSLSELVRESLPLVDASGVEVESPVKASAVEPTAHEIIDAGTGRKKHLRQEPDVVAAPDWRFQQLGRRQDHRFRHTTHIVQSAFPLHPIKQLQPVGIDHPHPLLEDRFDQAVTRPEMIMQGGCILLPSLPRDLAQGHAVDAALAHQSFSGQKQELTGIHVEIPNVRSKALALRSRKI